MRSWLMRLTDARTPLSRWLHWVIDPEPRGHTKQGQTPEAPGASGEPPSAAETEARTAATEATATPYGYARLRFWVAIGIVIGAISAAAAAWRAEIFTEYASQKQALFRQDLTNQQLSERSDEEQAISQLRQLAPFERDLKIAYMTQQEADSATGKTSLQLGAQAQNDWMIADTEQTYDFSVFPSTSRGNATLNPGVLYAATIYGDPTLASFDPADLDTLARSARADAQKMAIVGVFFALSVVFFTLSEMALRRKKAGPHSPFWLGHAAASVAVVIWVVGIVLFALLYVQVPQFQ